MVINTNISAQTGARLLSESASLLSKSLARLSSGSRLVSPEDDSAGMAVSTRFDAQINRIRAATSNVSNAISFAQTQDGYLKKIGKALDRMSELAVLAQDVTKTNADRGLYNLEFQTLNTYINDVVTKDFNGVSLFSTTAQNVITDSEGRTVEMAGISGSYLPETTAGTVPRAASTTLDTLQPGIPNFIVWVGTGTVETDCGQSAQGSSTIEDLVNSINIVGTSAGDHATANYNTTTGELSVVVDPGYRLYFTTSETPWSEEYSSIVGLSALDNTQGSSPQTTSVTLTSEGSSGALDISTASGAASALTTVKSALSQLASDRATVGATIARLNMTVEQLGTLKDNLSAANSRIKDVDVAEESTQFARYNILVQAGTAMLSQANNAPSSILRLLA